MRIRALLLSDRIDTAYRDRQDVVAALPLTFRRAEGLVTLFRYGVVAMIGLSPADEEEVIRSLQQRLVRPIEPHEEEIAEIEIGTAKEEQVLPGGTVVLKDATPEHLIVIADALSKSVVLARDERQVASVLELVEPFARHLAEKGSTSGRRPAILKHIGHALLIQHRVSGRAAVTEKPDVLWDRHDLERLYARLEDEYELKERSEILSRKLTVIAETAGILTDIIDTRRSLRLEFAILILIAIELVLGAYQMLR